MSVRYKMLKLLARRRKRLKAEQEWVNYHSGPHPFASREAFIAWSGMSEEDYNMNLLNYVGRRR